ncbi:hypothetical protein BZA70DRAFT_294197 [Myxozyma melibiosi]|uniref:Uncharacterized protein n=1 Tax=Myxozyma melibiosi TaxID=54550 RepID=A0ABR1FAF6_9ASCO
MASSVSAPVSAPVSDTESTASPANTRVRVPRLPAIFNKGSDLFNYQEQPETILPIPSDTDDLETAFEKLVALVQVVESGKSIAINTGFKAAKHDCVDPVAIAKRGMTLLHLRLYEASPPGAASASRFAELAAAMSDAWEYEDATAEHVAWLSKHHPSVFPLLKAIVRVYGAARDLVSGQGQLTALELADLQTYHKLSRIRSNLEARLRSDTYYAKRLPYSFFNFSSFPLPRVTATMKRRVSREDVLEFDDVDSDDDEFDDVALEDLRRSRRKPGPMIRAQTGAYGTQEDVGASRKRRLEVM